MTKAKREGIRLSKEQILDQIKLMSDQTERLLLCQKKNNAIRASTVP